MDTGHPIDLLPGFVFDILSDEERADVAGHLAICPACRLTVSQYRRVSDALAVFGMEAPESGTEPRAELRDQILAAAAITPQAASPRASLPLPIIALPSGPRLRSWLARHGGWVVAAVLFYACLGLGAAVVSLQQQVQTLQQARQRVGLAVALAATPDAPGATGQINPGPNGARVVTVSHLPPPQVGDVYEAWVINPQGPQPAGTFVTTPDGIGAVALTRSIAPGDTIAITREAAPGTASPKGKVLLKADVSQLT